MSSLRVTVAGLALGASTFAVVALLPATSSTAAKCPSGESKSDVTDVCVPTPPSGIVQMTTPESGGPPEIDGVPCTGHNSYECIGLAEEDEAAGPTPTPHPTWTSSP